MTSLDGLVVVGDLFCPFGRDREFRDVVTDVFVSDSFGAPTLEVETAPLCEIDASEW